jgi:hypothetical protein
MPLPTRRPRRSPTSWRRALTDGIRGSIEWRAAAHAVDEPAGSNQAVLPALSPKPLGHTLLELDA